LQVKLRNPKDFGAKAGTNLLQPAERDTLVRVQAWWQRARRFDALAVAQHAYDDPLSWQSSRRMA
jgi:hypothetical protein